MTGCQHENFVANVDVHRLVVRDSVEAHSFMAQIKIHYTDCGAVFGFRGPPAGLSWSEPRCDVAAITLHAPLITPAELELAGPLPAVGRGPMIYEGT